MVFGSVVTDVIQASSNSSFLLRQIDEVDYPGGGSSTDVGIQRALTLLLEEPSSNSQAMVVITDGVSNYPQDTLAAASSSKSAGVFILAVGIDVYVKQFKSIYRRYQSELQDIASSNESVIQMANFEELSGHASDIVTALHRSALSKETGNVFMSMAKQNERVFVFLIQCFIRFQCGFLYTFCWVKLCVTLFNTCKHIFTVLHIYR